MPILLFDFGILQVAVIKNVNVNNINSIIKNLNMLTQHLILIINKEKKILA